jgi:type VI protein secretion system component VasF
MHPEFATATLPLLGRIIDLVDRAQRGDTKPVELERAALRRAFDSAEALLRGPRSDEWRLTSYALASFVDEMLIVDTEWDGRSWWENHALEVDLFGSRHRATAYFRNAEIAASLPVRDVIHVYVLGVLMGFRGIFRDQPERLEVWLRTNAHFVRPGEDRPPLPSQVVPLAGAPPLYGSQRLLTQALVFLLLGGMLMVTAWWAFWLA